MSSDVVQFLLSPDKPYFRLSTFGNAGDTHVSHVMPVSVMVARKVLKHP